MNYFLALVVLGLCGLVYYGGSLLQEQSETNQHQLCDLNGQIRTLQSTNTKTEDTERRLTAGMADLATQITAAKSAVALIKKRTVKATLPADSLLAAGRHLKAAKPKPKGPPLSNDLGTITTLDGRTFEDCHLIMVESSSIVFTHSDGIMDLPYPLMKSDLQKRFGYDPHQGPNLTDAQVQDLEQERQAASGDVDDF